MRIMDSIDEVIAIDKHGDHHLCEFRAKLSDNDIIEIVAPDGLIHAVWPSIGCKASYAHGNGYKFIIVYKQEDAEKHKAKYSELSSEWNRLNRDYTDLVAELKDMEQTKEQLAYRCNDYEMRNKRINEENIDLHNKYKAEIENADKLYSELALQFDIINNQNIELTKENKELERKMDIEAGEFSSLLSELEGRRNEMRSLEKENKELREEFSKLQFDAIHLESTAKLSEEIESLKEEISRKNNLIKRQDDAEFILLGKEDKLKTEVKQLHLRIDEINVSKEKCYEQNIHYVETMQHMCKYVSSAMKLIKKNSPVYFLLEHVIKKVEGYF